MVILITGSAGFIGSALSIKLLARGDTIIGIDNHNNYYDPKLKEARLARHNDHKNYTHIRMDITDKKQLDEVFADYKIQCVVNLAAQTGVRYSLKNPSAYIESNLVGFCNILEVCRYNNIKHLVYASSSSVYGANRQIPHSVQHHVDHPVSLYAATKKANELMAHTYSHLYNLPTTGLRFFTVYGPWDRPDMALQKFTKAIIAGEPIKLFNYGNHRRDFTYIDDIVNGIKCVIEKPAQALSTESKTDPSMSHAPWRIYNIGSSNPHNLTDYIKAIENNLGLTAKKEKLPMQPGDVENTYADINELVNDFDYKPLTTLEDGVRNFTHWYLNYPQLTTRHL